MPRCAREESNGLPLPSRQETAEAALGGAKILFPDPAGSRPPRFSKPGPDAWGGDLLPGKGTRETVRGLEKGPASAEPQVQPAAISALPTEPDNKNSSFPLSPVPRWERSRALATRGAYAGAI